MIARSTRPVIGVLDPYHPDAVSRLRNDPTVDAIFRLDKTDRTIFEEADAVLIRSETALDAKEFAKFRKLKYVIKQGVGVDNVDLEAAAQAGVEVYNTPGLNSEAVAELALALALSLGRRLPEIDRAIRSGKTVVRSQTLGTSLFRKVLGVVGMGNIGISLAKKWIGAMEGEVLAFDPYYKGKPWHEVLPAGSKVRRVESLEELLQGADVVSLHVPLTNSTRKMISKDQFDMMKEGSILLNCARGGIVDESALVDALASGKLAGVGLDAMEIEPPTADSYSSVLRYENVVLTPHIGASTIENQRNSGMAVVDVALDLVNGKRSGNRVA